MNQPIIQQPPQKKYDGEYIGKIESVDDPENLMRVQVRVLALFSDEIKASDLPWAEYKLPIGARPDEGIFNPVRVGDYVWVDFPYNGDTRRPRITGSVHYCPGKIPNLPTNSHDGTIAIDENGFEIELRADKSLHITQKDTGVIFRIYSGIVQIIAPQIRINGDLDVFGDISATGTIIDSGGNTNHHSH